MGSRAAAAAASVCQQFCILTRDHAVFKLCALLLAERSEPPEDDDEDAGQHGSDATTTEAADVAEAAPHAYVRRPPGEGVVVCQRKGCAAWNTCISGRLVQRLQQSVRIAACATRCTALAAEIRQLPAPKTAQHVVVQWAQAEHDQVHGSGIVRMQGSSKNDAFAGAVQSRSRCKSIVQLCWQPALQCKARTQHKVGEEPGGAGDAAESRHAACGDCSAHHAQRDAVRHRHVQSHQQCAHQHSCFGTAQSGG